MIGHRRVLIASLNTGVGNFLDRRSTVAPFGVHLQIAAVPARRSDHRRRNPRAPAAPPRGSESVAAAPVFAGYRRDARSVRWPVRPSAMRRSRGSRVSRASNPVRCRNSRQGAVGSEQVGQRPVQREDRGGRPLVTEHLLLRRLRERQIAKVPAHNGVHVRICSRPLHRRGPELVSVRFGQWRLGRPGDHVAGRLEA